MYSLFENQGKNEIQPRNANLTWFLKSIYGYYFWGKYPRDNELNFQFVIDVFGTNRIIETRYQIR